MEAQLLQFHKTRYECAALASVVCPECNLTLCLRPFDSEEFANDKIHEFCPRCAKQITFSGLFLVIWIRSEFSFVSIASSLIDNYGKIKDPTTRVLQLGDRYVQFRQVVGKNVAYYIWDGVRSLSCFFCPFSFNCVSSLCVVSYIFLHCAELSSFHRRLF